MSEYLKALEQFNIQPNFWCSEEYFRQAQFREISVQLKESGDWICFVLEKEPSRDIVFPPFNLTEGGLYPVVPKGGIWADLVGFCPDKTSFTKEFLDYNYIYDPAEFQEMKGRKWTTFRKNSRKFPRRWGELYWIDAAHENDVGEFASKSLGLIDSDEIHDASVILNYIFNGENRLFLFDKGTEEILAVNIWDENYKYVNYRYAFCVGEPFLSEYVRLCFYQMVSEKYHGKLVNDGGILGRPSLERFKDKLNPVEKLKIYSWE